jgi:hypothetical protein
MNPSPWFKTSQKKQRPFGTAFDEMENHAAAIGLGLKSIETGHRHK